MIIIHDFLCLQCGKIETHNVRTEELPNPYRECSCKGLSFITYTKAPNAGQRAATDNYFGDGVYDYGAGQVFKSRKEQQAWMDSKGLELAEDMSVEEFEAQGPAEGNKIEVKENDLKDAMQRAEQKIRDGWKPPSDEELHNRLKESTSGR